jgi:hypothetical protein
MKSEKCHRRHVPPPYRYRYSNDTPYPIKWAGKKKRKEEATVNTQSAMEIPGVDIFGGYPVCDGNLNDGGKNKRDRNKNKLFFFVMWVRIR